MRDDTTGRRRSRRGPRPLTPARLERIALHHLERFACSQHSLRQVLRRRALRAAREHGGDPAAAEPWIDDLVARFVRSGLLDDRRYAEGRAKSLHRQGRSGRAIAAWLSSRGVGAADVRAAIDALAGEHAHPELAAAVAHARRRRLGPWRGADREERRERDLAALARRGFSLEVARRVLAAPHAEALEELLGDG